MKRKMITVSRPATRAVASPAASFIKRIFFFALWVTASLVCDSDAWAKTSTEWTRSRWESAAKLHEQRCSECHRLYDPKDYTEAQWTGWFRKMKGRARLSLKEATLLSDYAHAIQRNDKIEFKKEPETPIPNPEPVKPRRVRRPVGL